MPKILGIDYGSRRIGVAVADSETRIATPLTVLQGRNEPTRDARSVADLGDREAAGNFVVGLPLNMSEEAGVGGGPRPRAAGSDSIQTIATRRFAAELERLSGKPVHLQDERLTSFAADEVLDEAGIPGKRRKGRRDMIAAQKILQAYLDRE